MRLARLGTIAASIVIGILPQTATFAVSIVTASYGVEARISFQDVEEFDEGPLIDSNHEGGTASLDIGNSTDLFGVGAISFVNAHAAVGDLGLKISGSASVPSEWSGVGRASAYANSSASWSENVILNSSSRPMGSFVWMTFNLTIDGDIAAAAVANGSGSAQFNIEDLGSIPSLPRPTNPFNVFGIAVATPTSHILEEIPGALRMGMSVPVGVEFKVGYRITLGGTAVSDSSPTQFRNGLGGFESDVSGSLHWGGIESVEGPFGIIPRDQWSITSESGFDYSKSFEEQVPEPSTFLSLLLALGSIHLRPGRWRKRTSSPPATTLLRRPSTSR